MESVRAKEVWIWSTGRLRFFAWNPEGYREVERSSLVSALRREGIDELATASSRNRLTASLRAKLES